MTEQSVAAESNSAKPSDIKTIWTIGHSTRPIDEFLALLAQFGIETIVDVRSFPGSKKYPQYGQTALEATLRDQGIAYKWFRILGGRRRTSPSSPNTVWRNTSFRGYADYMSTPDFTEGLEELLKVATGSRVSLMCAEAVWWRCHRSMISDALCVRDIKVLHIMADKHAVVHPMTAPARVDDGKLTYGPAGAT